MTLALTHATVIDPVDGSVLTDADVVIEDGRIRSVGQGAAPAECRRIEATGKYIIPGLVEMHSHALNEPRDDAGLRLMLAYGITGFRQMSGSPQLLKDRAEGSLELPTDAPDPLAMPGDLFLPFNAGTPEDAVSLVRAQAEQGADFVKIGVVAPPVLAAAQREARELGLPVVGHLPSAVDVPLTSRLGFQSIEHLGPGAAIVVACSSEQQAIRAQLHAHAQDRVRSQKPPANIDPRVAMLEIQRTVANPLAAADPVEIELIARARETFDPVRARELAQRFVADGTWQCPTLIRMKAQAFAGTDEFLRSEDTRYLSDAARGFWMSMAERFEEQPEELRRAFEANYALLPDILQIFVDSGVRLLAGSDSGGGATGLVPGPALHREFVELMAAGVAPLHILQGATSGAGEFLGLPDVGRVAPTFRADLLVLDGNPLDDITNTGRIAGLVKTGSWISREQLEETRSQIAAARSVGSVPE